MVDLTRTRSDTAHQVEFWPGYRWIESVSRLPACEMRQMRGEDGNGKSTSCRWRCSLWPNIFNISQYIPVEILYIWVVAIVLVIAFGGGLSLSRVLWKSAYSRSNMKPKSIPKEARKWIEELFVLLVSGASATLHVPFILHSFVCIFLHVPFICMHLPFIVQSFPFIILSCSFHLCSCPFIFLSYSFHVDSNVHSCPFHLPFICMHVPFMLHSCLFISF